MQSETSPLLSSCEVTHYTDGLRPSGEEVSQKPRATPLPRAQLATLCAIKLVEPINFTQIFPYVNEQIQYLNISDRQSVGLYSGVIESSFAVAQLLSVVEWARLSDRIGRKPVIIAGTLGVVITSLMFGMSRSFFMLVLSRALAGLFCGNIAALQSVLGEITDSSNQAVAFPLFAMTWPMGSIIGPLIGGSLSNPASKFAGFNVKFFQSYPYFLPCLVASLIALVGAILGLVLLEETSPLRIKYRREKSLSMTSVTLSTDRLEDSEELPPQGHDVAPPPSSSSIKQLLQVPILAALSLSGLGLSFVSTAFDVVFVLFAYSPIQSGGLSLSDGQIGLILAVSGCLASIIQVFILPALLRRFWPNDLYTACLSFFPSAFALLPVLNMIAQRDCSPAVIWTGVAISLLLSRIGNVAYALSMILIKENTPNAESLGAANGLVQWSMCLARAIAPAAVSCAFALSQQWKVLHGHCWAVGFILLIAATLTNFIALIALFVAFSGRRVIGNR